MGSLQARASARPRSGILFLALSLFVVFGGCSDDGNGGGGVAGVAVVATSFFGSPAAPGGQPPEHFLDEVLLVTLSGPIDNLIFGGFFEAPGASGPAVLEARIGPTGDRVLYFVYDDQNAASQAFQVLDDTTGLPLDGLVGRSVTDPSTLVFDPRIAPGNPLGLAATSGFETNRQYDIFIPEDSNLRVGGRSVAPFGALPPVMIPDFADDPGPATLLVTGSSFLPDSEPPSVVEVTTMTLEASGGTPSNPIPFDDVFIVRFSEEIDLSSLNLFQNVVLRNLSVTTPEQPSGIILPTNISASANLRSLTITPTPSLGAGPFDIELTIGSPQDSILDRAGNGLATIVTTAFTTVASPGALTITSLLESFDDSTRRDANFVGRFNDAEWDTVVPGGVTGLPLSGSPDGTDLGTGPGARTQISITPIGTAGPPGVTGYFSPFDDNQNNNFGATINPDGGSHLQLLYNVGAPLATDLPAGLADSLELLEWRAAPPGTSATTFNGFTMQMGHTVSGAFNSSEPDQLTVLYSRNFNFDNPQNDFLSPTAHPDPTNLPNEAPVTVIPPQPYTTPIAVDFIPFPVLALPFDFDHNRTEPNILGTLDEPNMLIDINIDPVSQPSGNTWLGTTVSTAVPFRRLTGGPGAVNAFNLDSVVYHARMTFVKKNSSARTAFFDSGSQTAQWTDILINPPIERRPSGSALKISIQGVDSVVPEMGLTPLTTFLSRNGVVDPTALDSVQGKQFVRLLFEFESDTQSNAALVVEDLMLSFVP